jgi:hypothetical protein
MEPLEAMISIRCSRSYKMEFIVNSNDEQLNMTTSPAGLGPKNDCAGEDQ